MRFLKRQKSKKEKRSIRLVVLVPPSLKKLIEFQADEHSVSEGEIVRRALEKMLVVS